MKISTFQVFIFLILGFSSCSKWDFDKKVFPKCTVPSASLSYSANQLSVNFTLASIKGDIDKIEWTYGDGSVSTTTSTSSQYTYGSAGAYTVTVKISNKCGDVTILKGNLQVINVTLATVTTLDPRDVKSNTATLGLVVNSFGNSIIIQSGVCYSTTNSTPTVSNSTFVTTAQSVGLGTSYYLNISNLSSNTVYYVRAFCQNSAGIAYGVTKTFQTEGLPFVSTLAADSIGSTNATLPLKIDNLGNPVLSRYGIMLSSTSTDPGKSGGYYIYYRDTNGDVTRLKGAITSFYAQGLIPNTVYYYRAYATNAIGTFYGQVNSFTISPAIALKSGLVVYLPLDGNATDESVNNFATTMWGTTTSLSTADRKGTYNGAMNFNGIDNYIAIGDSPLLRTSTMSVSFWMKPNNLSGKARMNVVGKTAFANSQGEQYSFGLNFSSSQVFTYTTSIKQNSDCVTPGQNWQNMAVGSFSASNWQHMVYTFENGVGKLYVNGVLRSTQSDYPSKIIDNCSGGNLRIGAWWKDYPDYFQGSLDELRIYNRAINAEEVKALYNQ